MTAIAFTDSSVLNAKRALTPIFPNEKSAHLTEALAAACGYGSHAALRVALGQSNPADPDFVLLDDDRFVRRLQELTGEPLPGSTGFPGFERLRFPSPEHVVRTQSKGWAKIRFESPRSRAWRNAMVSGINAGIAQRLFSVRAGDNRWPGANTGRYEHSEECVFHFAIEDIPAIASVSDAGWDELTIHVALWPTADGVEWIPASNAGFEAGEVFASGWLERRDGAWLQVSPGANLRCRKSRLETVAALAIEPHGYADRGDFRM